jgi:hypothetical protein
VVERSRVGDRYFNHPFHLRLCWVWITWDRVGPFGGCSPRLCRLRTNGLAPARKYWTHWSHVDDMSPISLIAGCQQKLGFSPLHFWLFWERSWIQTREPVNWLTVGWVESPSSRKQWIYSNLLTTTWKVGMRGPCEIHMVWDHTRTERRICVTCCSGSPCRVYEAPEKMTRGGWMRAN